MNSTPSNHCANSSSGAPYIGTVYFYIDLVSSCFGFIALCLNVIALHTFCTVYGQIRRISSTLRTLLILLSICEIGFTFSYCVHTWIYMCISYPRTSAALTWALHVTSETAYLAANVFTPARNWCIVLIALSRLEVVIKPFAYQQGKIFTKRTIAYVLAFLVVCVISLSVPRLFTYRWHLCQNEDGKYFLHSEYLDVLTHIQIAITLYFSIQSVIPPCIVAVSSVVMILMLRHRESSQSNSAVTKSVLVLLGLFSFLEGTQFIMALLCMTKEESTVCLFLMSFGNNLIVLDSCCNFVVYMSTTREFRHNMSKLLVRCCFCCPEKISRQVCLTATDTVPNAHSMRHSYTPIGSVAAANDRCPRASFKCKESSYPLKDLSNNCNHLEC